MRNFYVGEMVISKHSNWEHWGNAVVINVRPNGKIDIKWFGGGTMIAADPEKMKLKLVHY